MKQWHKQTSVYGAVTCCVGRRVQQNYLLKSSLVLYNSVGRIYFYLILYEDVYYNNFDRRLT